MIHGIRVKSNWLNRGVCIFKVNELNSFYTYYFNRFRSRGASKENINNTGQGLAFFQPLSLPNNFCTVPWKLPRVSYVSHRAVQGALRTTGWRRREAISLQQSLLPLNPAAEFSSSSSSGRVEKPFAQRDRSHLEPQPWGQTRRQPTPQKHTHTETQTRPCASRNVAVRWQKRVFCLLIIHAHSWSTGCTVVSVMQRHSSHSAQQSGKRVTLL